MNVPKWTRERIVAAIQAWASKHGRPPSGTDWRVTGLWEHPSTGTVLSKFGTWNAAIVAAGFQPRQKGFPWWQR